MLLAWMQRLGSLKGCFKDSQSVVVKARVESSGRILDAKIDVSSGHPELDRFAQLAVLSAGNFEFAGDQMDGMNEVEWPVELSVDKGWCTWDQHRR